MAEFILLDVFLFLVFVAAMAAFIIWLLGIFSQKKSPQRGGDNSGK